VSSDDIPTKSGGTVACVDGAHASIRAHASNGNSRLGADNGCPPPVSRSSYGKYIGRLPTVLEA